MATCADCLHSGICAVQLEPHHILDRKQKLIRESNNVEHECLSFKDHSRFVELPCKVGDSVFTIDKKENIQECIVTNVNCKIKMALIKKLWIDFIIVAEPVDDSSSFPMIFTYSITKNKILFLTKESAEQAIKERENND